MQRREIGSLTDRQTRPTRVEADVRPQLRRRLWEGVVLSALVTETGDVQVAANAAVYLFGLSSNTLPKTHIR